MFGLFKKTIPAPQHERAALVKRLFLERYENSMASTGMDLDTEDISGDELLAVGVPEATILSVVEQFLSMRDQGSTEEFAVMALNQIHSAALTGGGEVLTELQHASTLFQYVRHIVDTLHGHGEPISDHFLIGAIQEVKSYYKR